MIPEGWALEQLGNLFDFKNGLNGEKARYGSGVKFANVMDVFRAPRLRQSEIVGSMQVTDRQLKEYGLRPGDVLFNRTSETDDEIALASVFLDDKPAVFGGFVIRARPTDDRLAADFNVYAFQSDSMRREMVRLGQGAIRANIGQGDLATVPMLVPPLPEQRRIAEILSTWDGAIETVEALIANARAQKKALMQSVLTGKRRLPGFSGDWLYRPFGDIAERVRTKVEPVRLPDHVRGIELEHIESETGRLLGTCRANAQASLKTPFSPANVLYGKLRPYLRKYLRPDFAGVCSTEIWVLAAKPEHSTPEFLHLLVQSPTFESAIDVSSGSKMPRGDWGIVRDTVFAVPSAEEQEAISRIVHDADEMAAAYEAQLAAFRQEKSAVMQQLLTGKRRVNVGQREAA